MNKDTTDKFSMGSDFIKSYYNEDRLYGFKCYSTFIDLAADLSINKVENEISGLPY